MTATIVATQLIKAGLFTLSAGRDDVADLHLRIGHHHAVQQELDQLALLLEARLAEPLAHPCAEALDILTDRRQVDLPHRLLLELAGLLAQSRQAALHILAPPLVFS